MEKGLIELPEGLIKTPADVDSFLQDNLATKLPLDGPQWRYYFTNITTADGQKMMIQIYKCHHSLADGISTACVALALSEEYSSDYFVKVKLPTFFQVCFIKFMAPFYLAAIALNILG